ncbi:hypothetical protein BCR34DRAFT_601982 [Clohesyomyces aquaticus]|uniref:Uncharacterized protein n=1 Tax=Clohesyomyces aquaticus TaxID=1231657 RepID=A0A1Y1ZJV6_9PLEO|nr:hypothetical protein BCR34DRAFT_601982 [Clohesyomyces aquaticus]
MATSYRQPNLKGGLRELDKHSLAVRASASWTLANAVVGTVLDQLAHGVQLFVKLPANAQHYNPGATLVSPQDLLILRDGLFALDDNRRRQYINLVFQLPEPAREEHLREEWLMDMASMVDDVHEGDQTQLNDGVIPSSDPNKQFGVEPPGFVPSRAQPGYGGALKLGDRGWNTVTTLSQVDISREQPKFRRTQGMESPYLQVANQIAHPVVHAPGYISSVYPTHPGIPGLPVKQQLVSREAYGSSTSLFGHPISRQTVVQKYYPNVVEAQREVPHESPLDMLAQATALLDPNSVPAKSQSQQKTERPEQSKKKDKNKHRLIITPDASLEHKKPNRGAKKATPSPTKPKKTVNAFMLYNTAERPGLRAEFPDLNNGMRRGEVVDLTGNKEEDGFDVLKEKVKLVPRSPFKMPADWESIAKEAGKGKEKEKAREEGGAGMVAGKKNKVKVMHGNDAGRIGSFARVGNTSTREGSAAQPRTPETAKGQAQAMNGTDATKTVSRAAVEEDENVSTAGESGARKIAPDPEWSSVKDNKAAF